MTNVALVQQIVDALKRKDARTGRKLYSRIAVVRAEWELSRQELADAIGLNYQRIRYLERGDYQASLGMAFRLTEFFPAAAGRDFSRM